MKIDSIYGLLSPIFRGRRFVWFLDHLRPADDDVILDVGGRPDTWTAHSPLGRRLDVLNLAAEAEQWEEADYASHHIRQLIGDGCDLNAETGEYDIVFSNSVIEHVGTWENQQRFADEVRRVGRRLWIQTPAWEFFIEPHYMAPFVHWIPRSIRKYFLRYFTVWGWLDRPSLKRCGESVAEIRLISYRELRRLFPDCKVLVERFLWVFPKSYIAYRDSAPSARP